MNRPEGGKEHREAKQRGTEPGLWLKDEPSGKWPGLAHAAEAPHSAGSPETSPGFLGPHRLQASGFSHLLPQNAGPGHFLSRVAILHPGSCPPPRLWDPKEQPPHPKPLPGSRSEVCCGCLRSLRSPSSHPQSLCFRRFLAAPHCSRPTSSFHTESL